MKRSRKLAFISLACVVAMLAGLFSTVSLSALDANGPAALSAEDEVTSYGTIPAEYPVDTHPFALFTGETFVGAYTKWSDTLAAAKNATAASTILVRKDWKVDSTNGESSSSSALGDLKAPLTVDLNGKTMTRGDKHLFQMMGKGNDVSVTIKNGTVDSLPNKLPIVFNNNGTTTNVEHFTVTFENVTFVTVSDKQYVHMDSYGDGTTGLTADVIYNNCTFDYTGATNSKPIIFELIDDTSKTIANDISVTVNGGQFKAKKYDNISIARFDNAREGVVYDSIVFGKYNGSYTKFIATEASEAPNVTLVAATGESIKFSKTGADSAPTYEIVPNITGESTAYGLIPEEYPASTYPFALFTNGAFVGAYKTWKSTVENAAKQTTASTIFMRADWNILNANGDTGANNYIGDLKAPLTIDLNGKTITRSDKHFLNMIGKGTDLTVTVKNGTVASGIKAAPIIFNNAGDSTNIEHITLTFENVTFTPSSTESSKNLIIDCYNDSVGLTADVIFNNCTFDLTNANPASGTQTIFNLKDTPNHNDITVTINGGQFKAKKYDHYKFFVPNDAKEGVVPDTVIFGKYNGNYTKFIATEASAAPSVQLRTTDGKPVEFTNSGTASAPVYEITPVIAGEETPYGTIPGNYPASSYPFALFSDGYFVKAYTTYYEFLKVAESDVTAASTLLVRKDWDTSSDEKSGNSLGRLKAPLTIDLGGHTMTRGSYHLFQILGAGRDITLTIKNGKLVFGSGLPPLVFNNTGDSTYKEHVTVTFEKITFAPVSDTNKKILFIDSYGDGTGAGLTADVIYNNCTFDLAKATGKNQVIFELVDDPDKGVNKNDIKVIINGGEFKAATFDKFIFANFDEARDGVVPDSVVFGKYNGNYTKFTATAASEAPNVELVGANGEKIVFKKSGSADAPVYTIVAKGGNAPDTGDTTVLAIIVAAVATVSLAGVYFAKKRTLAE